MPVTGAPLSEQPEGTAIDTLQAAAAADGNGQISPTDGYNGALVCELNNSGTGTTNLNLEGSFDRVTWYALGYQQVDAVAIPQRAASAIAVSASPFAHVYVLLDTYPWVRARMAGSAGAVSLTVRLYKVPV